jgi:hypothetical protein
VYARQVEGTVYTFGVSGKLIRNAMVMYDHQTRSLWSHFLGQAVKGELVGTVLDFVPVTHTTWAAWRELNPDTLVLDKRGRSSRDSYQSYYTNGSAGVIGESVRAERLPRKERVVGVAGATGVKAYSFSALELTPVVNDTFADLDVVVLLDAAIQTGLAYSRTVEGRTLTFDLAPDGVGIFTALVDRETGSRWLALTGRAVVGEMKGATLERVLSHLSFWFAWTDWNPETALYGD